MKISFSGIFWGLFCIGIGCFFLYGTWGYYLSYHRLQEYDGRTSGFITKKHLQPTAGGSSKYYLDYWFMPAAGGKISVSSVTDQRQWDMLRVGDSMEIRYDQSNPNRNIPMYEGSPSLILVFVMLILGVVFAIFGGSRIYYSIQKRHICT